MKLVALSLCNRRAKPGSTNYSDVPLFAMVDDADFEIVSVCVWVATRRTATATWYAVAASKSASGKLSTISMHRFLMDPGTGLEVDHRNGNGLDNQRDNLRLATSQQQKWNVHKIRGKSRFLGVGWDLRRNKWRAVIMTTDGVRKTLGHFVNEEDAARCYDRAALAYRGEFAHLNFPVTK